MHPATPHCVILRGPHSPGPARPAPGRPLPALPPRISCRPAADRVSWPLHVKRVTNAGTVRLKKRLVFIANALKQHPIGLEEVADGIWSIYFCRILLVTSYTRCKNEAA